MLKIALSHLRHLTAGLWLAVFAALLSPNVFAHPLHLSIAEASYNRAAQTLEISVRVFADDFAAKLSSRSGRRISLEKTPAPEIDALSFAYLGATFTVKSASGTPLPLRWVGREFDEKENYLWFHIEVALPGGPSGARIFHGVLTDEFDDQLNSLFVRDGKQSATLVYFPQRSEKIVTFRP